MRNSENIGHIVGDKRAITSLSLIYIAKISPKISAFCLFNIYGGMKAQQ